MADRVHRLPDWPSRLVACIQAVQYTPWAWGRHDCCTLAADAVLAITGVDRMASIRGQWSDTAGAARVLKRLGGMRRALTTYLGPPLPGPQWAQRGDVVLISHAGRHSAGICIGAQVVGAADPGLARLGLTDSAVLAAWGI